jgi:hypothetical protein
VVRGGRGCPFTDQEIEVDMSGREKEREYIITYIMAEGGTHKKRSRDETKPTNQQTQEIQTSSILHG